MYGEDGVAAARVVVHAVAADGAVLHTCPPLVSIISSIISTTTAMIMVLIMFGTGTYLLRGRRAGRRTLRTRR